MMQWMRSGRLRAALACAALVVGVAACEDDPAPLFQVPGTGSVQGLVFFDADRNSIFDPSSGDRALPGVRVRLQLRGTTSVIAGTDVQTNANGRFTIANVPVGTHELAIDTVGVGAGVTFCQNPIPVNVYYGEALFQPVGARGGCVIFVAEAEQLAAGSPATVRGTVVSAPGQINTADQRFYLQDVTGGIRINNPVLAGFTVAIGDVVEVSGTRGLNAQEFEITSGRVVDRVAGSGAPTPAATTTKAIADAGADNVDPLLGTLVVVRKARVTTAFNNGTGSSRNAFIDDGSGPTTLRIDTGVIFVSGSTTDLVNRLNEIASLNKCYDITGIASNFNQTGQLFPRSLADIVEVPCS